MKALIIGIFLSAVNAAWSQSTWYEISTPTSNKLNAIDFANSSIGYIVGDSTTILKTTDGGVNWAELSHSGLPTNAWSHKIVDVDFVTDLVGFVTVLDDNDGVYKTVDGGMFWTPAWSSGSNMCYKSSVFAAAENDYFVGGAGCFQSAQIEHSLNSVWTTSTVNFETFNPDEYVVEMDFQNNIGLAVMKNQHMLRSTDNGITWDTLPVLLSPGKVFTSVMFSTADTVYAGYEENPILPGFGFLMSVDAGLTWNNVSTTGFFYPAARDFTKSGNFNVYAGGVTANDMGIVFETTVLQPINGMDNYGSDVVFAVGDSGYVVTNVPLGNIGIDEDDSFSSVTIYPNPTTDIITIRNEDNEPIVYNLINYQGRIVIEDIEATNNTTIDLSEMPSGMYFLKSTAKLYPTVHKISKL